jgi:hypothetical protein
MPSSACYVAGENLVRGGDDRDALTVTRHHETEQHRAVLLSKTIHTVDRAGHPPQPPPLSPRAARVRSVPYHLEHFFSGELE